MKWQECNRLEDLKKLGSFKEVKILIKKDLPKSISISAKSWCDLYASLSILRELFSFQKPENRAVDGFVSEEEKYLFCLTKLDGANRQDLLGVSRLHYSTPEIADKWYKKIAQRIHPDKTDDNRAKQAFQNLKRMYSEMAK